MVGSCFRFSNSQNTAEIPVWFLEDERKHRKKPVPVTQEMVEEYKQKWKEINARPIKRLAEAKARKKRRVRERKTELGGGQGETCREGMEGRKENLIKYVKVRHDCVFFVCFCFFRH